MKIWFFSDNYPPEKNAAASRVHERAVYWARWGHGVTVFTGAPNFPEGAVYEGYTNAWHARERREGVDVVRVKTYITANEGKWRRIADYVSYLVTSPVAAAWEAWRHGRPDTIAATSPQFFTAVAAWVVAAVLRRPFVFEISDLWPASIAAVGAMRPGPVLKGLERLELFLYRRAAQIVAQTPAFRDDLVARGVDPAKISVVLNGVEISLFQSRARDAAKARELGVPEGRFVVGYLGTLGLAHGLENVLAAAERLDDERVCFLLMGPGAEREKLMAEVRRRALGNVIIAPPQPKPEMPRAWSVCDLSLVHLKDTPVFATVIPSKIFEAMAMAKPVLLAAPTGEASRLVEAEGAGRAIPAGDPARLASEVRAMAGDAEGLRRMGERSAEAAPRYSREKQAGLMLEALAASCRSGA